MKDNFSRQSALYAKFRPVYPKSLYDFIYTNLKGSERAWDCGTGNGQVAAVLAKHFKRVVATDISEQQLSKAPAIENISYEKCREELPDYPENFFDLITVAQAIHWFDFEKFYNEVNRVGKQNGLLAVWGYELLRVNAEADTRISNFYENKIGAYWDPERKLIDEKYATIPFPFEEIEAPAFDIQAKWTLNEFEGYLNTWSSVQKYIISNQENPVSKLIEELKPVWHGELGVKFPVFLRLGRIS